MQSPRLQILTAICLAGLIVTPLVAADEGPDSWRLPDSLAQWYKPDNERQVWLHTMFALRREMQAVREYTAAGDTDLATKWASRLAGHYRELPRMVPEWRDELELEALDNLEQVTASGDSVGVKRALRQLRRSCNGCHRQWRALATARLRAPVFASIQVQGVSGVEPFADHMDSLSLDLNRVQIASEDGRWGAGKEALARLRGGLQDLETTCKACHREDPAPAERILGAESRASLDQVAEGLGNQDPRQVGRYLGQAAVQVCARCHGVHRALSDLVLHIYPDRP